MVVQKNKKSLLRTHKREAWEAGLVYRLSRSRFSVKINAGQPLVKIAGFRSYFVAEVIVFCSRIDDCTVALERYHLQVQWK